VDGRLAEIEIEKEGLFPLLSGSDGEVGGYEGLPLPRKGTPEEGDAPFFLISQEGDGSTEDTRPKSLTWKESGKRSARSATRRWLRF